MAKLDPAQFVREVRQEAARVESPNTNPVVMSVSLRDGQVTLEAS